MYEQFYGLKEKPFNLTPDTEFLFLNGQYQAALDQVIYGIKRREGFTVIVGDVGTGKTTLCWALLERLDSNIRTALVLNPLLSEEDMLRAIVQDLGIRPRAHPKSTEDHAAEGAETATISPDWMRGMTRKQLIDELNFFLTETLDDNVFTILIIDEAQNLSPGVLEQLRILSNLETSKKKLLQIIFVGQLEFNDKLELPELRQLNQRISIRFELRPLSKEDMSRYIDHRLEVAGASDRVCFTRGAVNEIYKYSKGYPRLVNLVCDRALLGGYQEETDLITGKMVRKAIGTLQGRKVVSPVRILSSRAMLGILASCALVFLAIVLFLSSRGTLAFLKARPQITAVAVKEEPVKIASSEPSAGSVFQPQDQRVEAVRNVAISPPQSTGNYALQVYSFKSAQQAAIALSELEKKGYRAFLKSELNQDAGQWYAVYVGPFSSLNLALAKASALQQREGISPVIRINNFNQQ